MEWFEVEDFSFGGEGDVYNEEVLQEQLDQGVISDEEMGFMLGYLTA